MSATDQLTDEEFERHALDVLRRELGPEGLARFLRLQRGASSGIRGAKNDQTLEEISRSLREYRREKS